MDSGNSGSLLSSSGDEEYDSRPPPAADSISALMNNNNKRMRTVHGIQQGNPSQINVTNFDPLANYFDAISRQTPAGGNHTPQSSLLNLDMLSSTWSKTTRSDLNPSTENFHHHNNTPAAMISSSNVQPFSNSFTDTITMNPPAGAENINTSGSATNTPRGASDRSNNPAHVGRKKRSRASRRAPTTVLTTDTTNFRAMVQEFTGIPAPPFTSSSPFTRTATRFDLFGNLPSNLRSNIPLDSSQTPSYLRRPFPQKVQLPPPVPPPPSLPFLASTSSASSSSPLLNSTSMVDLDHTNNFNSLPNHFLLSSSLVQQKFPPSGLKVGGMNILDQFGQFNNTGSLISGLPGLISSDQTNTTASRNNNDSTNPMNWDGNGNGNLNISSMNTPTTNGKPNFTGNPSNFHAEKVIGTDNVATATAAVGASRGEGMMESWVCSSD